MKIAYPVLARPGGAQANTHAPDVCQAVDCANSQRFPSTGDLCLTCWTRERKGERLPRKGSGRGGGRPAHKQSRQEQKRWDMTPTPRNARHPTVLFSPTGENCGSGWAQESQQTPK